MEEFFCSNHSLESTLQRNVKPDFKMILNGDKIQNVLFIHDNEDRNRSFDIDLTSNSVTTNQSGEVKNVHKSFLFDSVSYRESAFDNVLLSAIKRVADKEDSFIFSVSRGLRGKANNVNQKLLHTLVHWLLEYLVVCIDTGESRSSVRLSGLEIDEEIDAIRDLGSQNTADQPVTLENQSCHRCVDPESADNILKQFHTNSQRKEHSRQQYLYTIHVYQHTTHCSISSSVSSQCSRIFLLLVDLTKHKNNENCLSPPGLAKLLMASMNKNNKRSNIQSNFQSIVLDISRKYASNFAMISHISMKEKHLSDTYQMLQISSRIQRLKVKSKKCWDNKEGSRPNRPTMGTSAYKKGEKYSDSEVASTSEMSCAETVIFIGDERRRNSDDESRRFRSLFMSSDSDSGYRDLKFSHSGGSRGTTPISEAKKQIRLRTNALVWPKSALRMAKTALMNGEELWVDGPNAFGKVETNKVEDVSLSVSSTPETIKHMSSPCCQYSKPIMVSQETQCEDSTCMNDMKTSEDTRPLSDISEVTEDNDTLRNNAHGQIGTECRYKSSSSQQEFTTDEYSHLEKNDVQNLSNWIHDVNEITTYQEFLTKSQYEIISQTKSFMPLRNESVSSPSYQYYDPGSQAEYNSFPRVYTQIQYKPNNLCNPVPLRCSEINIRDVPFHINDNKLIQISKKKDNLDTSLKDKDTKSKSFRPLELFKKTLMRKKKKDKSEKIAEVHAHHPRFPDLSYLMPTVHSPDESSDSTSSDSECNEWFRKVKTFKSKPEYIKNKCTSVRPPSAPLLAGPSSALRSQYSCRQRSSSSGYGSVVTRDSEISSHQDSTSDQSIHIISPNIIKQSTSFSYALQNNKTTDELDPEVISKRCELLVKQEKAFLLIQQQEMMIQDFYASTRPLLTQDNSKYTLRVSAFDCDRVTTDNQYLEELEEDTNIIRDSIAFYKSLVHLESSFITSPDSVRRNLH